ncbi:MAG TPA: hypothetical protein VNX70_15660 [Bryobacteraceae bacterium]|nr:hypothetical protein [Bryobacteraceae bacterium]
MSSIPLDQQLLLALQACALVGLILRLWWNGLYRIYPRFFSYLLLTLLQTAILPFVPYSSLTYGKWWMLSEGLIVCAYVLVILELCKVLLRGLPGITSVARRYIKWTLAVATFGSLLLLGAERAPLSMIGHFFTCERSIVSSVTIFVLLMMLFLVYNPVPLNRNVITYALGYGVYFLTKAAAIFLRNVSPAWSRELRAILVTVSTGCLVFWLFALNRRGEIKTTVVGHQWSPETERQLLLQLQTVNASLARVLPRS